MPRHGEMLGEHRADPEIDLLRDLVRRAQIGDVDAWEALYRRLRPQMFSFARRRLPADHLADDAISETMERALRKLDTFTWQGAGFDAWMIGILHNVVLETRRAFGRTAELIGEPDAAGRGPLAEIVHAEEHQHMRDAFARLTEEERELLELRTVAKVSAAGVGEILGMNAGAVRMAQSRALKRLTTMFEEVNGER